MKIAVPCEPPFAGLAFDPEDQTSIFDRIVNIEGASASEFFSQSGIAALAERNGGLCAFRLGDDIALYQSDNRPLVEDVALSPSLAPNAAMFGAFMGTMRADDPLRRRKRVALEAVVGSPRFFDAADAGIRVQVAAIFAAEQGKQQCLSEFALKLVAHVVSTIPGLLDFHAVTLRMVLESSIYREAARGFFESASKVISAGNDVEHSRLSELNAMMRYLLAANLELLDKAPPTNLVRQFFDITGIPLSREGIEELDFDHTAELATIVMATFDTTALTLVWLLVLAQTEQAVLTLIEACAREPNDAASRVEQLEFFVLEAIRLGGSNPTALWRRTVADVTFDHGGRTITVSAGTMIWLDRWRANRDSIAFPAPERFDLANIMSLRRKGARTALSMVSRGRYEINSFSMINTLRNQRKCPGRLFTIRLLAILVDEMLRGYDVRLNGGDAAFRRHSAMPQPRDAGTILLTLIKPPAKKEQMT